MGFEEVEMGVQTAPQGTSLYTFEVRKAIGHGAIAGGGVGPQRPIKKDTIT